MHQAFLRKISECASQKKMSTFLLEAQKVVPVSVKIVIVSIIIQHPQE